MKDRRAVKEELLEALGSESKLRILLALSEHPYTLFTTYSIMKATGLRRQDANKMIKRLCELGWVKQQTYGIRKYQLNVEKEEVKHLLTFLKSTEAI